MGRIEIVKNGVRYINLSDPVKNMHELDFMRKQLDKVNIRHTTIRDGKNYILCREIT